WRSDVSTFSPPMPMAIVAVDSPADSVGAAAGASAVTSRVPHWEQKRASSGFCLPHAVQNGIGHPPGRVVRRHHPRPTLRAGLRLTVGQKPISPAGGFKPNGRGARTLRACLSILGGAQQVMGLGDAP